MQQPSPPSSRQPVLPSHGGLLGRNFVYRAAEKTDVRLTWAQARADQCSTEQAQPERRIQTSPQ